MMEQMIFVLFSLVSITVSSDVVKLVGDFVQLHIQNPVPEFNTLFWKFNKSNNILKYNKNRYDSTVYSWYKDRVEFNDKIYSLTLKNLQKNDSGLYTARVSGEEDTVVAEYSLSVLDPVETPVLTHQLNRDTCNITLTCRGHNLSMSSSCYKDTCEEQEVTSPGSVTLSLSVNGSSIICNHSNPVSWKKDVLEMGELKRLCADKREPQDDRLPNWLWAVVVTLAVLIILLVVLCIYMNTYRRKSAGPTQQSENTVYAEVKTSGAVTTTMPLETPSTVYSVIGNNPQPSRNSENKQRSTSVKPNVSGMYKTVPDQMPCMKPETIYGKVSKPRRTLNAV